MEIAAKVEMKASDGSRRSARRFRLSDNVRRRPLSFGQDWSGDVEEALDAA
jgi:hypothetical protein